MFCRTCSLGIRELTICMAGTLGGASCNGVRKPLVIWWESLGIKASEGCAERNGAWGGTLERLKVCLLNCIQISILSFTTCAALGTFLTSLDWVLVNGRWCCKKVFLKIWLNVETWCTLVTYPEPEADQGLDHHQGFPRSQAWWHMPLFPDLRSQKQVNPRIEGQPGLHRESQDNIVRPCLKT